MLLRGNFFGGPLLEMRPLGGTRGERRLTSSWDPLVSPLLGLSSPEELQVEAAGNKPSVLKTLGRVPALDALSAPSREGFQNPPC